MSGPTGPAGVRVDLNGLGPWLREIPDLGSLLERAVRLALETRDAELSGSVSLALLPEEEIVEMNRRWFGREGPTDVISFELGDEELMADLYVAPEVARRRAAEASVPLREELARLAVHGTLHALGHDHPEGDDRWDSAMYGLQERLVARAVGSE